MCGLKFDQFVSFMIERERERAKYMLNEAAVVDSQKHDNKWNIMK